MKFNHFTSKFFGAALAFALVACGAPDTGADETSTNPADQAHGQAEVRLGTRVHKMPMNAAVNTATVNANLQYYGGHVISNVKVYAVNWNGNVNSTVKSNMGPFYSAFTVSPMFDWLSEYNTNITAVGGQQGTNQIIGHGTFAGSLTLAPSITSTTIDDTQIQSELGKQISSGALPAPDANTIYMVNFPKGLTITQGGSNSCQAFCAYHGTFTYSGQSVYYGVLPSLESGTGCDLGCGNSSNMIDNQTSVASHELIEAVTDAEVGLATTYGPPLAWYDQTNGEIGDICNAQQGTFTDSSGHVWTVQKEFDNQTKTCITSKSVSPSNDFSVSLSSTSLSVAAGSSTTVTVKTAVTSGSAQSVSLSVSGLPSGVTGSFSPASVTAGGTSTLTLTAASTAAAATATFTVKGTATSGSHSTTGSLTVTSSGGGGGGGGSVLSNGVPVTGLSGAASSKTYFTLSVPSGASNLKFAISGGTGDADMYVKFGAQPTTSTYDCRPYVSGNNETCSMSTATAGTWYVMLNGYAAYSGVTLTASYTTGSGGGGGGGSVLTNGVAVTISGASGSSTNYTLPVTAGTGNVTVTISGGTGDADLYVKFGSAPTTTSYTCRPYLTGNNESCSIPRQAGTLYIMVHGYAAYSGVSLLGKF